MAFSWIILGPFFTAMFACIAVKWLPYSAKSETGLLMKYLAELHFENYGILDSVIIHVYES